MKPKMSVSQMLNSFIFIVKGSRVIDLTEANWSNLRWVDDRFVKDKVYSLSELRQHFAYPPRASKWNSTPLEQWLAHPRRMTAPTLSDAMRLADEITRGLVQPPTDLRATDPNAPEWVKRFGQGNA